MGMREDCKHYQSRTYSDGEAARVCALDMAPEAPWRCPDGCVGFERRMIDAGWNYGSLAEKPVEAEPIGDPADFADLLAQADDIVNEIAPEELARIEKERHNKTHSFWAKRKRRG
jgi:hypothetical protein